MHWFMPAIVLLVLITWTLHCVQRNMDQRMKR